MSSSIGAHYLDDVAEQFRKLKNLAERALEQVAERALFIPIDPESNSLAVIMKHLAGNMRSRWTDFLTTDGEKPDRQRDREFEVVEDDTRDRVFTAWDAGWRQLFDGLGGLGPDDLLKDVTIRGERHSVLQAVNRQLQHIAYHVGQIVFLAKHLSHDRWKTLSIPRGKSEEFNARMRQKGM